MSSPFTLGTRILAAGAAILGLFLLVGFLLEGRWEVERTVVLEADPEVVFPHLDSPRAWRAWTTWPDTGLVSEGPARGAGARMSWNHPEYGDGLFEIVETDPVEMVRYRVAVEKGTMVTTGVLRLEPEAGGTRLTWRETGDFGWNPLMGYWALAMETAQGRELTKGLQRLSELVGAGSEPADSVSTAR